MLPMYNDIYMSIVFRVLLLPFGKLISSALPHSPYASLLLWNCRKTTPQQQERIGSISLFLNSKCTHSRASRNDSTAVPQIILEFHHTAHSKAQLTAYFTAQNALIPELTLKVIVLPFCATLFPANLHLILQFILELVLELNLQVIPLLNPHVFQDSCKDDSTAIPQIIPELNLQLTPNFGLWNKLLIEVQTELQIKLENDLRNVSGISFEMRAF